MLFRFYVFLKFLQTILSLNNLIIAQQNIGFCNQKFHASHISLTIRIGREILCLPYAEFLPDQLALSGALLQAL